MFLTLLGADDSQLARMIEYLKAENEILRSKLPQRITVTPQEKSRLVGLGEKLGNAIKDLVSIVTPRTFLRWVNESKPRDPVTNSQGTAPPTAPKLGRPKTPEEIEALVVQLARDNSWGYTRILGELKKLGVQISRSTVVNILKDNGLDVGPKHGPGTWADFISRHAATLWASDFFSVKSLTMTGFVDLYVLFFIHIQTRRVFIAGVTANPDNDWVTQQGRNFTMHLDEQGLEITHLVIDRDTKYTAQFDSIFGSEGAKVVRVSRRAPNMNSVAERFVGTIKRECLDHFLICGEQHLLHILREFKDHYHENRPHQSFNNEPLSQQDNDDGPTILAFPGGEVKCRKRLGGLLKHYYLEAG